MPRYSSNQIGTIGEWIAAVGISRAVEREFRRPLFRAAILGEKHPLADFLVDVLDDGGQAAGFFLVQVKSTFSSSPRTRRASLAIPESTNRALAHFPVPTYLLGVELGTRSIFLAGIAPKQEIRGGATIGRRYPLSDDDVLVGLYREVSAFWDNCRPLLPRSRFLND